MLYLYTGTPGSGKSLHVAKEIKTTLAESSKPIICNFPINKDAVRNYSRFYFVTNDELTPQYLVQFSRDFWQGRRIKEDYICLYVDEAQLLFNSRSWQQLNRMEWITFLSQHRHLGYRIVFIAQFDRMIDKQIRTLAEYQVVHRRFSSFGIRGQIISALAGGRLFCAVTTYYGLNDKICVKYFRGSKRLYRVYDTFGLFAPTDGAEVGRGIEGIPAPHRAGIGAMPKGGSDPIKVFVEKIKSFISRFSLGGFLKKSAQEETETANEHMAPT